MNRGPLFLTVLILAGLVYGSLYPFSFQAPADGASAVGHLLSTWHQPPQSRSDILANVLLYIPFGFLAARAFGPTIPRLAAGGMVVAAGAALSASMELLQFFDAGRDSSMSDVYLNSAGTLLGAFSGLTWGRRLSVDTLLPADSSRFALLVVLAWLGWRLFPYVPVIDLHKYWTSLKPVVLTPHLGFYDVFRYSTMWSAVAYLAQYGAKLRHPQLTIPIAICAVFAAKILIANQLITLPEIVGAIIAILYLNFVLRTQVRAGTKILAALFVLSIVLERLLPFEISGAGRPFEWIPFYGLLHGSLDVNLQSFMQKCFLYGAGLFLMIDAGLGLIMAATLESLLLLTASVLETQLAGRSGEITDALMVILLATIYGSLDGRSKLHPPAGRRASDA